MPIVFSEEQNHVINLRNRNILVSAAAGSGKTTVLVERIIRMISDSEHPVDIDHLLIVTFTKAAAASMREKISEAITGKLEECYSDHLQRQATLLHHAQITTIDSFCLFILQNNFNDIGLDPTFRVADEGEMRLLKEDVMEQLLEERLQRSLEENTSEFPHLLDRFATGNRLSGLKDILFSFYEKALSYPFVEDWLIARKKDYEISSQEAFADSFWMKKLMELVKRDIEIAFTIAKKNKEACLECDGPASYLPMMEADLALAQSLLLCDSYPTLHEKMQALEFATLSRKKDADADPDKKEMVKKQREIMKDTLKDLKADFFSYSIEEMITGFAENDRIVKELCDTVLDFHARLMEAKREKKVIDFSDMEHFALQILLKKEDDTYVPTKTALEYRNYFHEIMIDEYQDSNLVQEWLLKTISGEDDGNYNRFMVGDVKQSIYQFRLARPQIFMEKYDTYQKEVTQDTLLQRIDLAKNYRSRKEVIEGVNSLFYKIMERDLGNVSYDADSALYLGASYPQKEEGLDCMELLLVEKDEEQTDKKQQEARLVAHRIKQLIGSYEVSDDKGGLRKAGYGDVVILLRNLKGWDEAFLKVFEEEGIPLHVAKSTGYFSTTEIRTLLNVLKTLDNPKQDIPLFGTMTSWFGKFTDEEMAWIQSKKEKSLYDSVVAWAQELEVTKTEPFAQGDNLSQTDNFLRKDSLLQTDNLSQTVEPKSQLQKKCSAFLQWFTSYRNRIAYEPIHKILRALLKESGYIYEVLSLPGGKQRLANVAMLLAKAEGFEKSSYSGLFHFIRYIEKIQKYDVEFGEAGTQEEAADVVRMMTIHKSKGLEFPVCFVAGCSGMFNMRDSESALVCESDYGVGIDYVDLENRVRYKDIRKRFLAKYMQEDSLGEELRVLYVALTRAKEKLILTGFCKDFEKLNLSEAQCLDEECLPLENRIRARSYLDWILAANSPLMKTTLYTPQMLNEEGIELAVKEQWNKEALLQMVETVQDSSESAGGNGAGEIVNAVEPAGGNGAGKTADAERFKNTWQKELDFVYPHENLKGLYTKTSVSELKMAAMHKAYEKESQEETPLSLFPTEEIVPYIPNFAKESKKVSGSARGSAYHRLLELLDYSLVTSEKARLKEEIEDFIRSGRITTEEVDLIRMDKIQTFLESSVAKRMAEAQRNGDLYKEQPFVLGIAANRLQENFPAEEKVLIQGIIDVYFIEDDEIVLLDYKTDAVKTGEELVKRYKTQIDYYTEALERITGLKVKEKILYSFALGCEVVV